MILLYLYITIFKLYFLVLAIIIFKPHHRIRDKYTPVESTMCVMIYSHNNAPRLENLVKQLKNQTYPKNKYEIYVIADNCSDETETMFQSDLGVKLFNIKNVDTIGKDQAYSILVEKLSAIEGIDAYVFLDGKYYVNEDFLTNANYYLQKHDIITASTNIIPDRKFNLKQNIQNVYNKYYNNFICKTRSALGLNVLINSNALIIKKSIVDEIGSIDFKDINSELKYTLLLSKYNIHCAYEQDVKVYMDIDDIEMRIPSLSKRISLFCNCFSQLRPNEIKFSEMACSLIAPDFILLFLGYMFMIWYSYKHTFYVDSSIILMTFIVLAIGFSMSLLNAKIHSKDYVYFFAYPLYSICHMIYNFPPIRGVRNFITKKKEPKKNVETMTVDIFVTDGNQSYPCQLELISENGLAKVSFINKGKKYTTKHNHLRMIEAIKELSTKLEDYGLNLKICQCCKYFESNVDGSTNMIKGYCKCNFIDRKPGDILPTILWNTCDGFEKSNVVNILDAITKK